MGSTDPVPPRGRAGRHGPRPDRARTPRPRCTGPRSPRSSSIYGCGEGGAVRPARTRAAARPQRGPQAPPPGGLPDRRVSARLALPAGTFLASLVPWWQLPHPALAALRAGGRLGGGDRSWPRWPGRGAGIRSARPGSSAAVTVAVVGLDVITGSRLQLAPRSACRAASAAGSTGWATTRSASTGSAGHRLCRHLGRAEPWRAAGPAVGPWPAAAAGMAAVFAVLASGWPGFRRQGWRHDRDGARVPAAARRDGRTAGHDHPAASLIAVSGLVLVAGVRAAQLLRAGDRSFRYRRVRRARAARRAGRDPAAQGQLQPGLAGREPAGRWSIPVVVSVPG